MNNKTRILLITLFVVMVFGKVGSQELQRGALEVELAIPASEPWSDSGIGLRSGDNLEIRAEPWISQAPVPKNKSGQVACDPEGMKTADWESRDLPIKAALPGALIARLGGFPEKDVIIGKAANLKAQNAGHLFLGVNTDGEEFCRGLFRVVVRISPDQNFKTTTKENSMIDPNLAALIDRLPRRVHDFAAHEGDMVNFAVVGSGTKIEQALFDGGWVSVDRDKVQALLHAAFNTYSGMDYVQMPMSELFLFGRAQDFGYAQAEAYKVMASRHHFRLWRAPWIYRGEEVWVGAGTHDIGFEKDRRNGAVTHKIDPNIDLERDYIGKTLQRKGSLSYVTPSDALREGHNATGGIMQSDGRVLVVFLH